MALPNIFPKTLLTRTLQVFVKLLLKIFYRVEVVGAENFKLLKSDKTLIVSNHLSYLDAPILSLFLPESPIFAINKFVARNKLIKPFLSFSRVFEVDTSSPLALKEIVHQVNKGEHVLIFPEGRITVTGMLMKFYEGPAMVVDRTACTVLPIIIEGAEYSTFSRMKGKFPLKLFPKIKVTILPPYKPHLSKDIKPKERRRMLANTMYDGMCEASYSVKTPFTMFEALAKAALLHGRKRNILMDVSRSELAYQDLITRSLLVGDYIAMLAAKGEYVGVLLPNSNAAVVTFFALQAFGRVPAMLNFSVGETSLKLACETAKIKTIITSRKFVETAKLEELFESLTPKYAIVYLEDVRHKLKTSKKLWYTLLAVLGSFKEITAYTERDVAKPAVVLFTSGSEGTPKGVVLSHLNVCANRYQMMSRCDFGSYDKMFNALPMFHSFGLLVGTILPVLSGIRTFLYPSPLHYRIIPEIVYDSQATIMFGTDTFLSRYAKCAHPYDFRSLRYIFAGAEKLREETRKTFADKFGVRVLEGYGVTESSPVISVNTAVENRIGSVGKLMPGLEYKLMPVQGIEAGGRLYVKGKNIMMGYLRHENPGVIEPLKSEAGAGWHDTGDIVDVDAEGYVYIKGRAKRFAKIGGEMVSLTAVETYISKLWPDNVSAIISRPDAKKGEQLVLITNHEGAAIPEITHFAHKEGIAEISIPKKIVYMKDIPILGTGKVDYPALARIEIA